LISLSAIGLFYIYLLHRASWRYSLFLLCWIVPVAVLANFVRVIVLVLITYHGSDALAQGFLHSTAGMLMFMTALGGIFVVDALAAPVRKRLTPGVPA
jgi:exosortase/archaeosortase family protein